MKGGMRGKGHEHGQRAGGVKLNTKNGKKANKGEK
jgi:hypothetical protein